ncbi:MAG TPA: 7-cyano-7-deazaguanine synthase QueC [Thermoplasmata archaeon]|nr:7-cyano-7-deazaguanine synthase QueC [Thermoplasmata archaeon]
MSRGRSRGGSVVLLSGGMDSSTCLALAAHDRRPLHALTIVYGQTHAREIRSARAVARHFRVRHHAVVRLPIGPLLRSSITDPSRRIPMGGVRPGTIPSTYVPGRNLIFLSIALGYAESHSLDTIVIGANAIDYSGYPDCRPEFFRAFERTAALATKAGVTGSSRFRVRAPLLRMSKAEIVREGERQRVPWALTWSCYTGGRRPCGQCDSCRLRARGFRAAGVRDPVAPPA